MSREETRTRLLNAAMRLFHEQGFAATGVATILRDAGVNSGSLYHHFASKEDLLERVLDRYVDLLHPVVLDPVREREPDPVERVFALLAAYRQGLEATRCREGCPIGNLALEVSDSYPGVRPKIDLNFRNWIRGVASWLEQARGRFPETTAPDDLANLVLVVMEGGIMLSRARDSLEPFDRAVASLRDYFDRLQADRSGKENPR
jgi:TetR/AcrR family transcriptional repressor of nem operon